ncbi:lipopolysaccharide biosynthesis protein [Nocardioides sp. HB32]
MTSAVRRRSVATLGLGSVGAGILAYVFFVTAARALGPEDAASISVLWTWWSFSAAAVTFPLQHWIARTVKASGGERAVRNGLPRLAVLVTVVAVFAGLVSWVWGERLFRTSGPAFPALVVAVTLGAGLLGVVRGHLTGRGRFSAVGLNLILENAVRSVAALALAAAGWTEPWAFGLALVAGYSVAVANGRALVSWDDNGSGEAGNPVAAVGSTGLGQLLAQVALTGAPVVLALSGARPQDVTALFAGLALFRAPYTVVSAMMASVTGRLTLLWLNGSAAAWRQVEKVVVAVLAVGGTLVGALLGWWVGPWLVALVFGSDVVLRADVAALLAAGTVLAMANLVLVVMIVAQGRNAALMRGWTTAFLAGLCWALVSPLEPVLGVAWLFVGVQGAALVWLGVEEALGARHPRGLSAAARRAAPPRPARPPRR